MQIGNRLSFNVDSTDPYFFDDPLCKHADPEAWFDENMHNNHLSNNTQVAIKICGTCKHEVDCAAYAIVNPEIVGIWGATTTQQRKQIRKKLNINEDNNYNPIDDDNPASSL
jgi:hypothetical protein